MRPTLTNEPARHNRSRRRQEPRQRAKRLRTSLNGPHRIHGDVNHAEFRVMAVDRVTRFDRDGDARLQFDKFEERMATLGRTFRDFTETLVQSLVDTDSACVSKGDGGCRLTRWGTRDKIARSPPAWYCSSLTPTNIV